MALIDLAKFKKDGSTAEAAPDELPALPKKPAPSLPASPGQPAQAQAQPVQTAQAQPVQPIPVTAPQAQPTQPIQAPLVQAQPAQGGQVSSQVTQQASSQQAWIQPTASPKPVEEYKNTLQALKQSNSEIRQDLQKMNPLQKANPTSSLAPDELPPLASSPSAVQPAPHNPMPHVGQASSQIILPEIPRAAVGSNPVIAADIAEESLFFSSLISRFADRGMQQQVESELLSAASSEVISQMSVQWEEKKFQDQINEIDRRLLEKMQPLQRLEHEWRDLRAELDLKSRQLKEKEGLIKATAREVRNLLLEKNRLKEQHTEPGTD